MPQDLKPIPPAFDSQLADFFYGYADAPKTRVGGLGSISTNHGD